MYYRVKDKIRPGEYQVRRRNCPKCGWLFAIWADSCPKCKHRSTSPNKAVSVRIVAALGYVLFFLPLILKPKSDLARFHANQGLLHLLSYAVLAVVAVGLYFAFILSVILLMLMNIPLIIAAVLTVVNLINGVINFVFALRGEYRQLPKYGHIKILQDHHKNH